MNKDNLLKFNSKDILINDKAEVTKFQNYLIFNKLNENKNNNSLF